jgi:arginine decarboxylase-like protein
MFEHPNAKTVAFALEIDRDGIIRHTMTIETDLVLHALAPGYEPMKVDHLLGAVQEFMGKHSAHLDTVYIVPMGRAHASPS